MTLAIILLIWLLFSITCCIILLPFFEKKNIEDVGPQLLICFFPIIQIIYLIYVCVKYNWLEELFKKFL